MFHREPRLRQARLSLTAAVAMLCGALPATSTSRLAAADDLYEARIKPLLKEKCFGCHGAVKQEAGLRTDAARLIHQGSESGPVIIAGKAAESALIRRVTSTGDDRMPPEGEGEPLTSEDLQALKAWIDAGAPAPEDEEVLTDPRQHWTYQRPRRVEPPEVAGLDHPVDALLATRQAQKGLIPARPADRALLLRRVTFDLIGLPPTPEEISEFLADESPEAYRRVVDRLLDSPHYGERWGRHWMDVWRYSDWDGYKAEVRNSQKHIWHWRDWIIESLNADKGYDQMIREMLAADELAPGDRDALRATGFLVRNYNKANRNMWLDNAVEHTSKAFLGISLACARCHDHKYDPIPQQEYYTFRAIFQPYSVRTDRVPGETDIVKAGLPRVYDDKLDTPTWLFKRGNEKDLDKEHPLQPGVPAALGGEFRIEPVELPLAGWIPDLQDFVEQDDLAAAGSALDASLAAASKLRDAPAEDPKRLVADLKVAADRATLESLKARWAADRAKHLEGGCGAGEDVTAAQLEREAAIATAELEVVQKQQALAAAVKKAEQAPADGKKKPAAKNAATPAKLTEQLAAARKKLDEARLDLEKADGAYTPVAKQYGRVSSGRRTALAKWITAPENPLTARVAVNQIWMRHFGTPLVSNVVDFGLNAPKPEQLELLDWLAVELMTGGATGRPWSMKHLHRLVVTSQAYQRSSNPDDAPAANLAIDPENRLYWRANIRRLEGEGVRDAVLAAAGTLDRTFSGPDLPFGDGENVLRRSLYFQTAYEKQMLMLTLFDAANPADCYRRTESIIPQQALALSNSSLLSTQSRKLAGRLSATHENDEEFVKEAFLRILSRHATSPELDACREFLAGQQKLLSEPTGLTSIAGGAKPGTPPSDDARQRARENLILALFNHNDCVTVR
ncbi:Planctomycete cytochrome C [Caulifigura coniformis]|uniref:Planctomycete cytochrome C n=1 Tax=Caulifigura coniformis TaxID=2527983 RepID=A0A517SDB2_9PLAN|nr:PSD1 and planctomycete cytochrome C domain-containing protein [Caulifigura coniformis]QDT54097.1 Planctomycete cytochrome C [Caulifigura coniformis]